MRFIVRKILCICFVVYLSACSGRPDGVLSQQAMEDAMFDVFLAQAMIQGGRSSEQDSLISGVLAKHGITQADFDSSLVWYASQGEDYYKIGERVHTRLQEFKNNIVPTQQELATKKQRAVYDGFTLPISVLLGGGTEEQVFAFGIDSINIRKVDVANFKFTFRALGVQPQMKATASVCFACADTAFVRRIDVPHSGVFSIAKPSIDREVKNISGYVRLENAKPNMPSVFLYDLRYSDAKKQSPSNQTSQAEQPDSSTPK